MKCEVRSVECEEWRVKCGVGMCGKYEVQSGVWIVEWRVCSLMREVWSVKCGVESAKCEM